MAYDNAIDPTSDPRAEGHLPVAGEFDAKNIPGDNPLSTDEAKEE